MTFVRIAFFPDATWEHYQALERAMAGIPTPTARLVFAAGVREGGLQVLQVWTSRAELDLFNETAFLPALERLEGAGFPRPPSVTDFEAGALEIRRGGID